MNYTKKLICLDIETTGLNHKIDKIIEIGCVDITEGLNNKKIFHQYINPEQHIPSITSNIHGITNEKVKNMLPFTSYAKKFLKFIKNATLIIHNAPFDISFLNTELSRCNLPKLENEIIDTLKISKEKFPGQKATLDDLMKKFKITINREKHGALLDSEILAQVYIAMMQNQTSLELTIQKENEEKVTPYACLINVTTEEIKSDSSFFEKTK